MTWKKLQHGNCRWDYLQAIEMNWVWEASKPYEVVVI